MAAQLASITAYEDEPTIDAKDLAVDVYTYAYPLILMDTTRRVATSVAEADCEYGTGAPTNQFSHLRRYCPSVASNDIVRPTLDTLYSTLWFDVTDDPLIVSVPDAGARFYSLMLADYWTDVFASIGSRTTGTGAQRFAIARSDWQGELPGDIRVYRSPTALGSLIGLTQVLGADDVAAVSSFQAGLSATPWSARGAVHRLPPATNTVGYFPSCSPAEIVSAMGALEYLSRFCDLTRSNPPHAHDCSIVDRMRRVGLIPGSPLDPAALSPEVMAAMECARDVALLGFNTAYGRSFTVTNGWRYPGRPRGAFGTDYATRAAAAYAGLGVNASEDAISYVAAKDANGAVLDSSHCYALTFPRNKQPPAHGFWTLTLYDDRQRFASNPIERFALGALNDLVHGRDGSITVYVQRESPGPQLERNWLPCPRTGAFSLVLRLYWPAAAAVNATWAPPGLRRIDAGQSLAPQGYLQGLH
jgi:hypothetical protein